MPLGSALAATWLPWLKIPELTQNRAPPTAAAPKPRAPRRAATASETFARAPRRRWPPAAAPPAGERSEGFRAPARAACGPSGVRPRQPAAARWRAARCTHVPGRAPSCRSRRDRRRRAGRPPGLPGGCPACTRPRASTARPRGHQQPQERRRVAGERQRGGEQHRERLPRRRAAEDGGRTAVQSSWPQMIQPPRIGRGRRRDQSDRAASATQAAGDAPRGDPSVPPGRVRWRCIAPQGWQPPSGISE